MTDIKKNEATVAEESAKNESKAVQQVKADAPVRKTYTDKHTRVTTLKDKNHSVTIMVSSSEPEELDKMMSDAEKSVLGDKNFAGFAALAEDNTKAAVQEEKHDQKAEAKSNDSAAVIKAEQDKALKCMGELDSIDQIRKEMADFTNSIDSEFASMMPRFMRQTMSLSRAMDQLMSSDRFFF